MRRGILKAALVHYILIAGLIIGVWHAAMSGLTPHPEIVLKMAGAFCFLIGAFVVPLLAPALLSPLESLDSSLGTLPVESSDLFDARLRSVMILLILIFLPLLPLFLIVSPLMGRPLSLFDIAIFLQAILTGGWVYLLMEMTSGAGSLGERLGRRLALIIGFVLLHVTLVGLLAQLAFPTLQQMNPLKLLIDLNPFSQIFILFEGTDQNRLIINSDFQHFFDFRAYLLIVTGLVYGLVYLIYRTGLKSRPLTSY
jgi:hypothetical protein